jgi:hemolysin III
MAEYDTGEELANALSHGLGVALAVTALPLLVISAAVAGDGWKVVSLAIYGASLVFLYTASTLYHAFRSPELKRFFRKFDHAAIFVLIAGTYTPYALVTLRGPWGWTLFGVVWTMAAAGVTLKFVFFGRWTAVSVGVYLIMGWVGIVAIHKLYMALPAGGFFWLVAGGLSYTSGVAFYAWKKLPLNHAVWHLFVLGGSLAHFLGIYFYVLPS